MLYSEFQKLTKNRCTVEEYNKVNSLYMESDTMTHEDCAKVWEGLYGRAYKQRAEKGESDSHSWELFKELASKGAPSYSKDGFFLLPNGKSVTYTTYGDFRGWNKRVFTVRVGRKVVEVARDIGGVSELAMTGEGNSYFNA